MQAGTRPPRFTTALWLVGLALTLPTLYRVLAGPPATGRLPMGRSPGPAAAPFEGPAKTRAPFDQPVARRKISSR
jgi:hypothetical protein